VGARLTEMVVIVMGGSVMKGRACVLVTEEEGTVVALGGRTFMHKIWESSRARAWHGSGGAWVMVCGRLEVG
jgi:hypothetical protein